MPYKREGGDQRHRRLAALENGASHLEERAGRFPQVSGLTFTIDPRAPVGARVGKVRLGDAPLDPAATYRVAATNFLLGGGDGCASLANGKVLIGATDGRLLANEVMAYVRKLGNVTSRVEGRITIL